MCLDKFVSRSLESRIPVYLRGLDFRVGRSTARCVYLGWTVYTRTVSSAPRPGGPVLECMTTELEIVERLVKRTRIEVLVNTEAEHRGSLSSGFGSEVCRMSQNAPESRMRVFMAVLSSNLVAGAWSRRRRWLKE